MTEDDIIALVRGKASGVIETPTQAVLDLATSVLTRHGYDWRVFAVVGGDDARRGVLYWAPLDYTVLPERRYMPRHEIGALGDAARAAGHRAPKRFINITRYQPLATAHDLAVRQSELHEAIQLVEGCGASPELTAAVTKLNERMLALQSGLECALDDATRWDEGL